MHAVVATRDHITIPVIHGEAELKSFMDSVREGRVWIKGGPPYGSALIEELTPEMAKVLLDSRPENQRTVQVKHIGRITKDIRAHEYKTLGDPFHLNPTASLINAQHRCASLVRAWKEYREELESNPNAKPPQNLYWVPLLVLPDDDAIEYIDSCMTVRGDAAIRKIMGARFLTQSAISAIIVEHFDFVRYYVSKPDRFRICQESGFEDLAGNLSNKNRRIVQSGVIAGAIRCARVNHDDAWKFFSNLAENEQIIDGKKSTEVQTLYKFLAEVKEDGEKRSSTGYMLILEITAKCILAWNSWREGRGITRLAWSKDGPIPQPKYIKGRGDKKLKLPHVGLSSKVRKK